MRYFDEQLVVNHPRHHGQWWADLSNIRAANVRAEEVLTGNAAAVIPRDAWLEMDTQTRAIMRSDEGAAYMDDLMPLAKPINIGKLVAMSRTSSDISDGVVRSMGGQVPVPVDKTAYDYAGAPVPIFAKGYGREWREEMTLRTEGFDALADDDMATTMKVRKDMADYALNGDSTIVVEGYQAYGIRTSPLSKAINLGTGAGGASIDLTATATTSDAIEAFVNQVLGGMLDDNYIAAGVNLYVSPEISRNLDRPYSGSAGLKIGSIRDALLANRRINKITTTFQLTGNEFFGFVPDSQYIRPLVGMAVSTTPKNRLNITDNFQFMVMGAMGLEIRGDGNGRSGVFYSVVVN